MKSDPTTGCVGTDTLAIVVEECTGIVEVMNSNLTIYPNPTSDQITIDIKGYNGPVNVEVYDLQGRLLETTADTKVSLKKHAKGIYVLKVSYGEVTEEVRVVRD
ncbi:T9SS type A sorting domain-containing protein [Flavobacteriales bacterium]|nr:T9SS type A sorting domain-containing protein [Flavobacteriales bacterium]